MRYKILAGVLVLGLAISLGFNVYCYSAMVDKQATINNMRGQIIVAWAMEMFIAGKYLENTTTNIDIQGINRILWAANEIALAARISAKSIDLYFYMCLTPSFIDDGLTPYGEGSPTSVKTINPTAVEMFRNLSKTIYNMTHMIFQREMELKRQKGVDPISLLKEEGVLEDIINYCIDIRNLSEQIRDFSPKFQ